jgi:hypothetical protein
MTSQQKSLITYEHATVKFIIQPGITAKLPLKNCINSLFLNISNSDYVFTPRTKHHFIGLVEYLPELILTVFEKSLNTEDEFKLFQDYKTVYTGLYNNQAYQEGFILPNFHKYNSEYYDTLAKIWNEFYSLINTIIKHKINLAFVKTIIDSPTQIIWFNCIFSDLKNVFLENGLLGKNTIFSKKILANNGIKQINSNIDNFTDGIEPVFYTDKSSTFQSTNCSKTYILALARKMAASNDEIAKQLKKYYQLEKRFLRKYRDDKNYQIGYLTDSGAYIRGRIGRTPDNL